MLFWFGSFGLWKATFSGKKSMSGICGIYSPAHPALASRAILQKMLAAIGHRGPVARQWFFDPQAGVAVGHVFAPAFQAPNAEATPDWFEDAHHVVALDGVIFNDEEFLPRHASAPLHQNRNVGAVVEHLRQPAANFPEKLDGHFGLVVWDKTTRELWLGRDALGNKPLYYGHVADKQLVLFASELEGILVHPAVQRRLNREALTAYLTLGYVPAPLSIFENIHKVFPGEAIKINAVGRMRKHRYWHMPGFAPQPGELETFAAPLREHIIQAVAKQVGDGAARVGVFLSGGVDSTIVLAVLKRLGAVPERLTVTLGIHIDPSKKYLLEDFHWGHRVAVKFASKHYPILITKGHDPQPLLRRIWRQLDEPLLTPNVYAKYLLSAAVKQNGMNSCLSGSNVDMLFQRLSTQKVQALRAAVGSNRIEDLVLVNRNRLFSINTLAGILTEPLSEPHEAMRQIVRGYCRDVEGEEIGDVMNGAILRMQGAEKNLVAQDRVAMLHGVEMRHPFYEARLLDFVHRIPARFKGSESEDMKKAVLKCAFKDILPPEIAEREESGFPSYYWTNGEIEALKERLLSPAGLQRTGLLRPAAVRHILAADKASRVGELTSSRKKSAGNRTWALLVLQAWHELYLNQK